MSGATWPRYPPCASGTCEDIPCCALGRKFRWPELRGTNGQAAKAKIERENPGATGVILTPGRVGNPDFCCNRVFIVVNNNGIVTNIPTLG